MTRNHTAPPVLSLIACLLAWPVGAHAQVLAPEVAAATSQWGLGIGASVDRKAYRDFDDAPSVLPLVLYENRYVSFFGATLDAKLPFSGPVSFRLRARYADDGYEADDSPWLRGMAERKGGIWLGAAAIWHGKVLDASAELLGATGDARGKRVKVEVSRAFKMGAVTVTPRIAANWHDSGYVDYYYGVRAAEATPERAAYTGKSATNAELGLRVGYAVAAHHHVFVDVAASRLGTAIKDSPIVERSSQGGVRFGYLYAF